MITTAKIVFELIPIVGYITSWHLIKKTIKKKVTAEGKRKKWRKEFRQPLTLIFAPLLGAVSFVGFLRIKDVPSEGIQRVIYILTLSIFFIQLVGACVALMFLRLLWKELKSI